MRLRTRVNLAIVGISALSTFGVGASVLALSYNTGINQIRTELSNVIENVESSPDEVISAALFEVSGREITLAYVESDGTTTLLQETAGSLGSQNQQTKTLDLADGESLIFSASTQAVIDSTISALYLTLAITALACAAGTLLSWLILRKDMANIAKLTDSAERIASGELSELEPVSGSEEFKNLSQSLSSLVTQLQSLNNQMQEFLGDASHELKTPLTVIRGYLEMLKQADSLSADQAKRAIERAHEESLRMQQIISDILLLAELGEERAPNFETVNLEALFEPHVADLQRLNPGRSVTLITNQHKDLIASRELLERYVQNVFSNIERYTPDNAEVVIQIAQTPVGVDITVDDAGPGISGLTPETPIVAFTRFDGARSRGTGGTGLGLSIMSKIAERHGGKMELTPSRLGGLRVSVFLPN